MVQATDFYSEEEYRAALEERWATPGEADAEYARNVGAMQPERAWILSDRDVWYPNPAYQGPPVRHPEDDADDAMHEAAGDERVAAAPYVAPADTWSDDECPF